MDARFLPLALSLLAFTVSAGDQRPVDLELEPCINGEVSASGAFPTQSMEEKLDAYVAWRAKNGHPFYLFEVKGNRL